MAISTTSQQQAGTAGRANEPASRQPFVADIKAIRERARQHMVDGAVTAGYGKDQAQAHARAAQQAPKRRTLPKRPPFIIAKES